MTDTPEERPALTLEQMGGEVGWALGYYDSSSEAAEAYELAGIPGILEWLEFQKPKSIEGWEEYDRTHDRSKFPWTDRSRL